MTDIEVEEEQPPVAHVTVVYTGPAAPHWDLQVRYGDQKLIDDFWARVTARLLLLPKHDPQFRRNRERVNRDAERELIICDWDLGDEDSDSNSNSHGRNGQGPRDRAQQTPAPPTNGDASAGDAAAEDAAPVDEAGDTEQPASDNSTTGDDAPTADEPPPSGETSTDSSEEE